MLHAEQIEELITLISALERNTLLLQFESYRATFPLDFTREFLSEQPIERLRHIFLAICLQSQRMPSVPPQPYAGELV